MGLEAVAANRFNWKAFISYAWPPAGPERTKLQGQLLQVVKDLGVAGIDVILDILRLRVGMDINKFMEDGIESSNAILWIGTPVLKGRMKFNNRGDPDNPATIEFVHIQQKLKLHPSSLIPMWFSGTTSGLAFPPIQKFKLRPFDFRRDKEYFRQLPLIAATIMEISHRQDFRTLYAEYCRKTRALEREFIEPAIQQRVSLANTEEEQQASLTESKLKELLSNIPEQYQKQQNETEEAQKQVLKTRVQLVREHSLDPTTTQAQALSFYIPLKGGPQPDTPPKLYFDFSERVHSFLTPDNAMQLLLIQGGAGAGKTLFSHLLERDLWNHEGIFPLFISLPKAPNPYHNLVEDSLHDLGFSDDDVPLLRASYRFLFILDGLDELSLEHVPTHGLVEANQLLQWPNSKIIITCRPQYLSSLEKHVGSTYKQHLTQGKTGMEEFFLMPFDDTQVDLYLQAYANSPEAEWPDWKLYSKHLDTVPGLKTLSRTPFILKLLVAVLPRLAAHRGNSNAAPTANRSAVHEVFTEQYFEREMWKQLTQGDGIPLTENRISRFHHLAETLSQELFTTGTTQTIVLLPHADASLLRGLPLHSQPATEGGFSVSFVHKSVQEFFTAQRWLKSLEGGDAKTTSKVMGARIASEEANLIDFLCKRYTPTLHQEPLLQQVLASRYDKDASVSAANAITVLNATRFDFSYMDLSGISIPNAKLDNVFAQSTNFAHADLTGVSFRQAWLQGSDLRGAVMADVQFGEHPHLDFRIQNLIIKLKIVEGEVVVVGHCKDFSGSYIQTFNLSTGKMVRRWKVANVDLEDFDVNGNTMAVLYKDGTVDIIEMDKRVAFMRTSCYSFGHVAASAELIITSCTSVTFTYHRQTQWVEKRLGKLRKLASIMACEGKAVCGTREGTVEMWDSTPNKVAEFKARSVSLATFEGKILTGSRDGSVRLWDMTSCTQVGETMGGNSGAVTCMVTFEGKLICGSEDRTVRIWDLATHQQIGEAMRGHESTVTTIGVLGGRIISGDKKGIIRSWNMPVHSAGEVSEGHTKQINWVLIVNGQIISASDDATVCTWDLVTGIQTGKERADFVVWGLAEYKEKVLWYPQFNVEVRSLSAQLLARIEVPISHSFSVCNGEIWSKGGMWDISGQKVLARPRITSEKVVTSCTQNGGVGLFDQEHGSTFLRIEQWVSLFATGNITSNAVGNLIVDVSTLPAERPYRDVPRASIAIFKGKREKLITGTPEGNLVQVWNREGQCECFVKLDAAPFSIACSPPWVVVASFNRIQRWQYDEKQQRLRLIGMCPDRWGLSLVDCLVEGVSGLSVEQMRLLGQHGAKGSCAVVETEATDESGLPEEWIIEHNEK